MNSKLGTRDGHPRGRQTIGEIASRIGYESEAAFNRAFHRTIGVIPGAYRSVVHGEAKTNTIAALGALTCMNEVEKPAINQNAKHLFRRFAG